MKLEKLSERISDKQCPKSLDDIFLVSHDNKPKDEVKIGHVLPRLSVVEGQERREVFIPEGDPIRKAKDLESLAHIGDANYLTCESSGRCFDVTLSYDGEYKAKTNEITYLKVPPKPKFFNIESLSISLKNDDDSKYEICYDHRGGVYAGEEPWTRCADFNNSRVGMGDYVETYPEDPFSVPNKLNRAIADRSIGPISGKEYFVATIDTEGSEGIDATDDEGYSFIYTKDECIKHIPRDKVEGLYISPDETTAIYTTDNDRLGAENFCKFSLLNPLASESCFTLDQGIGGLAPVTDIVYGSSSRLELGSSLATSTYIPSWSAGLSLYFFGVAAATTVVAAGVSFLWNKYKHNSTVDKDESSEKSSVKCRIY